MPVQSQQNMKLNSRQISRTLFFTQSSKVAHTDSQNVDNNPECESNAKEFSQVLISDIKSMQ